MSYILMVQDSEAIAELAIRVLARAGYRAYAVANSAEALDVLRDSTTLPTLLLIDLCTPVMDGIAFRAIQQRHARLGAIPTISFFSYSNIVRLGAQHLFDGFLAIPFASHDLLAVVARYCQPAYDDDH